KAPSRSRICEGRPHIRKKLSAQFCVEPSPKVSAERKPNALHRRTRVVSKYASAAYLLTLLALSSGPVSAAQMQAQPFSITIAYTSISPQYSPVWIAKEAGFFKNNGINAQLVYMRGGIIATQALVSNDVNFISAGGGGVVDAVLGGAEICIVASPINQ